MVNRGIKPYLFQRLEVELLGCIIMRCFFTCTEYLFLLPRGNIFLLRKVKIHPHSDYLITFYSQFSRLLDTLVNYRETFLEREIIGLGRYIPSAVVVEGLYHRKEELNTAVCIIVSCAEFLN